jgi:hypothetical protein
MNNFVEWYHYCNKHALSIKHTLMFAVQPDAVLRFFPERALPERTIPEFHKAHFSRKTTT